MTVPSGQSRFYRDNVDAGELKPFQVAVKETDLMVYAQTDLSRLTKQIVLRHRGYLEKYLKQHPRFAESLKPLKAAPFAPEVVRDMAAAAACAGVGPMAAVAGAVAARVGHDLMAHARGSRQVVVENGGDIFACTDFALTVGIYAGRSPLSLKLGLRVDPAGTPLGVCTSSGTLGHSKSYGKADAVCIVSKSCALADAAATAVGNLIFQKRDIKKAIASGRQITGVDAIMVIVGDAMGAWGAVEVVSISGKKG